MERVCSYCLNHLSDPLGELTEDNGFSSISIGDTADSYRMSLDTGGRILTRIEVTKWSNEKQINETVCIYKPKYCPECGRYLFENFKEERKIEDENRARNTY